MAHFHDRCFSPPVSRSWDSLLAPLVIARSLLHSLNYRHAAADYFFYDILSRTTIIISILISSACCHRHRARYFDARATPLRFCCRPMPQAARRAARRLQRAHTHCHYHYALDQQTASRHIFDMEVIDIAIRAARCVGSATLASMVTPTITAPDILMRGDWPYTEMPAKYRTGTAHLPRLQPPACSVASAAALSAVMVAHQADFSAKRVKDKHAQPAISGDGISISARLLDARRGISFSRRHAIADVGAASADDTPCLSPREMPAAVAISSPRREIPGSAVGIIQRNAEDIAMMSASTWLPRPTSPALHFISLRRAALAGNITARRQRPRPDSL